MTNFNNFVGAAKRLESIDIPRIGAIIGVGEDELHAFMDVEAAGSGFDSKKRPKMLFEPHIFYKHLSGRKREDAVRAGLAYAKWKKGYPKDSYPRLAQAIQIDETAALKAASWGLTQILGENHKMVGYDTVQRMVLDFMKDEENHLEACVKFLIAAGIDDDLRAHRWDIVARVYNGLKYKENKYDTRMAAAFAKWRKIPDTPYTPQTAQDARPKTQDAQPGAAATLVSDTTQNASGVAPAPERITNKIIVEGVQRMLKDKGYTEVGGIDGQIGKQTRTAILAFRNENDLPLADYIDQPFIDALEAAPARGLERTEASPAKVREISPEVKTNFFVKIFGAGGAIMAFFASLFDGIFSNLGAARDYIRPLQEFLGDIPSQVWLMGITIIAGGLWWIGRYGEKKGTEAFRSGERR